MIQRDVNIPVPCGTQKKRHWYWHIFLVCATVVMVQWAAMAHAQTAPRQPVVVLTSYSEEIMSRFESAFEQAWPQYRLQVQWRMPFDALPHLQNPEQDAGVDVYWAASSRNFEVLQKAGALERVAPQNEDDVPELIGRTRLNDADGYALGAEMAAFGFVVNEARLKALGVPVPADWPDLANPKLAGTLRILRSTAEGWAPPLTDIPLQHFGWQRGWALWSEIAGLAGWSPQRANSLNELSGDAGDGEPGAASVALSIDFFVQQAIANGAPVRFVYPQHGGLNVAHIAMMRKAPNPQGARAFIQFVRSAQGQALLAGDDSCRLPVNPAAYALLPRGRYNPFSHVDEGTFHYDNSLPRARLQVLAFIYDSMLIQGHETLVDLWARIHAAEKVGHDMREVRALLTAPPLTETEAMMPSVLRLFTPRRDASDHAQQAHVDEAAAADKKALQSIQTTIQWRVALARAATARKLEAMGL